MSNHHPKNLTVVYFFHYLRLHSLYLMLLSLCTIQWVQKGSCNHFLWIQFLAVAFTGLFVFSAYCHIWISLDHRQTHTPVLSPCLCTGPESPLQSILPVRHCESGVTQQNPRACCVKWRDIFIWGKTRFSLLTKLVKSETWHFALLQGFLKYEVCWALWNENVVQWLIWYVAIDISSCWPLHREDSKALNIHVQLTRVDLSWFWVFLSCHCFTIVTSPAFQGYNIVHSG